MKKLIFILLLFPFWSKAQTTWSIQTVTSTATVNATARLVVVSSGAAKTITLPSSSTGRVITIVNHGTGDVTLSPAVRVQNGKTSALLSPSVGEYLSGISSNKITVVYDGSEWRLID
ncbi:hypothetical protein [Jiulongibacter sp. NS-SX5]|uniref:hypothetical protein n=1 Tax=Jiulongibacter sp. NS-SX5 TaxID=3463854 RepID=UPI004057D28D